MTTNGNNGKGGPGQAPSLLPLVPQAFKASERVKAASFKLFSIPGDNNAPKINFKIRPINGSETLQDCLTLFCKAKKVQRGCNIQNNEQYNTVLCNLLQSPALQVYDRAVKNAHTKHWKDLRSTAINTTARQKKNAGEDPMMPAKILSARNNVAKPNINKAMMIKGVHAVVSYMAPTKVLAKQTAWMRRYCRKPNNVTMKVFLNHLLRINNEELPYIPPKF
jgi:hypothetical protein